MTSPSDTDPPEGQRRPTLPGIPAQAVLPARSSTPTRPSVTDLPAVRPELAEHYPPRSGPQDRRRRAAPESVESVEPTPRSARAGTVGRVLAALGPRAWVVAIVVGLPVGLAWQGEGVARVVGALVPQPPAVTGVLAALRVPVLEKPYFSVHDLGDAVKMAYGRGRAPG